MGPQCEDGYTKIANELLDALCQFQIPGEPTQILWTILRKTYGFGKKTDRIALSQFHESTGIPKPRIVRAVAKLIELNLVTREGSGHFPEYGINKHYETWQKLPNKAKLPSMAKLPKRAIKIAKESNAVAQQGKINCPTGHPQKKKETITKEKRKAIGGMLPICAAWKAFCEHRKRNKSALTEYAAKLAVKELDKLVDKGYDPIEVLDYVIMKGWRGIYEPKELRDAGRDHRGNATQAGGKKTSCKPGNFDDDLTREFLEASR